MGNLNKIILVGRLTADPEIRSTMDSTPVSRFQLAVDRNGMAGMPKETDFVDIVTWRNLAEFSGSSLVKGSLALVEGRIQNRSYDTKDGIKKYVTEVIANNVTLLEKSKAKAQTSQASASVEPVVDEKLDDSFLEDDLPF